MLPLSATTLPALHPVNEWLRKQQKGRKGTMTVEDGRATAAGRSSPATLSSHFSYTKKILSKAVSDACEFSRYCLYSAWRNWAGQEQISSDQWD